MSLKSRTTVIPSIVLFWSRSFLISFAISLVYEQRVVCPNVPNSLSAVMSLVVSMLFRSRSSPVAFVSVFMFD
jgi:hypothetical protein